MKLTREEAEEIVGAFVKSNFRIHALGHFDLSYEEIVNIIMIIENGKTAEDIQSKLGRYYKILESKYIPNWCEQQRELI